MIQENICVVDCETGGTSTDYSLLQISLVKIDLMSGEMSEPCSIDICPKNILCNPEAMGVNGIDIRTWDGVTYDKADSIIRTWMRDNFGDGPITFCAWNVPFDLKFVQKYLPRTFKRFHYKSLDALSYGWELYVNGEIAKPVLALALNHFRIENDAPHTAEGDTVATAKFVYAYLKSVRVKPE